MSSSLDSTRVSASTEQPRLSLPVALLEVRRGWARCTTRPIAVPLFLIGCGTDCDLVLGDLQFPDVYCYVLLNEDGMSVRWLGRGPQLYVDDRREESCELIHGSVLRMGSYEFEVSIPIRNIDQPTDRQRPPVVSLPERDISTEDLIIDVTPTVNEVSDVQLSPLEIEDTARQLIEDVRQSRHDGPIQESRELQQDIRQLYYQETVGLRLYVEPDLPPCWIPDVQYG